jgi:cytoskeleton protein RodZ
MSDEMGATSAAKTHSIGSRLSQAREAKGLQLERAAEAMRLAPDVLVALEADRFDTLGAQVFVKGYLRQYAHLLDIDADAIIQGYDQQDHPIDEPLVGAHATPIKLRNDEQLRLMVAGGVGVVLLLAFFLWWWASPGATEPARSSVTASSSPAAVAVPVLVSEPVVESPRPSVAQPGAVDVLDAEDIASASVAAPEVEATSGPGPITFAVEVTFAEDCWAEIFGGDDRRLFYGLGRAGARSRFTATAPMTVLLGNAGGVKISVNGEAYPIPVGARQGSLARFVVVELP